MQHPSLRSVLPSYLIWTRDIHALTLFPFKIICIRPSCVLCVPNPTLYSHLLTWNRRIFLVDVDVELQRSSAISQQSQSTRGVLAADQDCLAAIDDDGKPLWVVATECTRQCGATPANAYRVSMRQIVMSPMARFSLRPRKAAE